MIEQYIREYFPVVASVTIGCAGAYSLIQTIKLSRRERGASRMPHWLIRMLAFAFSGGITTLVAYRLFGVAQETAVTYGVLVGVLYPVIMTAVMARLKKVDPDMYDRMRVPSRRATDQPKGPDDTQEFF
ncbi:MAG: hypothetical protein AB7K73_16030 [Gammaproteobacteria bacterium]